MTCIVGLVDSGNVYIGGDSAGVSGLSITIRKDEKVFNNGPFLIGFTSSFRMGQLLRYRLSAPAQTDKQTDMQYLVTDFVDSLRKLYSDNGFGKMSEKSDNIGGEFLLGYRGHLYCVDSDFQIGDPLNNYDCVGCGASLALGAMFATRDKKPEERIKIALEAASKFNGGVAPPFIVLKQPAYKVL